MATVLILDDKPEIRTLLKAAVEHDGHRALLAEDANQARGLLEEGPDVLFADIGLTGEDGIEFSLAMHAQPRFANLPILLVTANPNARQLADEAGLTDVDILEKPFRFGEVSDAVRRLLH